MAKVYIFLADGFEEIEGLTVVDLLRRADIEIRMISITGKELVTGAHRIQVMADEVFADGAYLDGDMIVLPGGMPGTNALMNHEGLRELLMNYNKADKFIGAICAAPSVLGMNGLLKGKKAVCFPGFEDKLLESIPGEGSTVVDGKIITSKGMGTAIDFGLTIIAKLKDQETADRLGKGIQYR
ncbi:MAG: DJ-1/PfpI family protein [Lachnospiraceae bacterium]|nr:DJ-1/PfpI family protein [Lachnospiraceae bacterium]